ncbi:optic atrophy 3 protein-domain-containing protein [Phlyctochytrium arcticum]|nr:optic atrophy 3 protein-domain-containing protein [Phlyctochytrium arcticum]
MATIKLGSLLIKTLAKPIANTIKNRAKTHPRFKDFCITVAQQTHRLEQNIKQKFLGYRAEPITPLNDARAVDMGASFMSETMLFGVAVATILGEAYRSSRKTTQRRANVDETLELLQIESGEQEATLTLLKDQIQQLQDDMKAMRKDMGVVLRGVERVARAVDVRIEREGRDDRLWGGVTGWAWSREPVWPLVSGWGSSSSLSLLSSSSLKSPPHPSIPQPNSHPPPPDSSSTYKSLSARLSALTHFPSSPPQPPPHPPISPSPPPPPSSSSTYHSTTQKRVYPDPLPFQAT